MLSIPILIDYLYENLIENGAYCVTTRNILNIEKKNII